MAVGRGKQEEEIKNRKVGRRNHLIAETILLPKPSYCRNHLIAETILSKTFKVRLSPFELQFFQLILI